MQFSGVEAQFRCFLAYFYLYVGVCEASTKLSFEVSYELRGFVANVWDRKPNGDGFFLVFGVEKGVEKENTKGICSRI